MIQLSPRPEQQLQKIVQAAQGFRAFSLDIDIRQHAINKSVVRTDRITHQ